MSHLHDGEHEWDYDKLVINPLNAGTGVACFMAIDESDEARAMLTYEFTLEGTARALAFDPIDRIRAAQLILIQQLAREKIRQAGFRAEIP